MYLEEMAKYYETEKQKDFKADFLDETQIENYEFWDEIEIGKETEIPGQFEVKAEDLKAFARGVPDDNPIFFICDRPGSAQTDSVSDLYAGQISDLNFGAGQYPQIEGY